MLAGRILMVLNVSTVDLNLAGDKRLAALIACVIVHAATNALT